VFPQARRWRNKETGEQGRHHIDSSVIQRTLHEVVDLFRLMIRKKDVIF
jgi:DNA integrase